MNNAHNAYANTVRIILVLVILGTLWVSFDGLHYWHDIRFMYATSQFSMQDILSGQFNPHQAWGPINEKSAAGFYSSKVLHIALLSALFAFIQPQDGGLALAVFLSAVFVYLAVLAGYRLFLRILPSGNTAFLAVISMLVAPITPYLAGKLLSEITSLLFVTVAILFLLKSQNVQGRKYYSLAVVSGVFLALASLARLDSIIGVFGFVVANMLVPLYNNNRSRAMLTYFVAFLVLVGTYISVNTLSGIHYDELYEYFRAFTGAGQKSTAMSFLGIAMFGGFIYLTAAIGFFSKKKRLVAFFAIWLLGAWIPMLTITWQYMVEPRYLIQGILPLAGLSALGLEFLLQYVNLEKTGRKAVLVLMAVMVTGTNYLVVRLMPYELDRPAILSAVHNIQITDKNAQILVPWSYTDFNFLRVMLPDAPVYNVNSPEGVVSDQENVLLWEQRFRRWYGDSFVSEPKQLDEIMEKGPVYYLGWKVYPPVQNIQAFVKETGLTSLQALIERIELKNHLEQSWVWSIPGLKFILAGRSGQYEYYRLVN